LIEHESDWFFRGGLSFVEHKKNTLSVCEQMGFVKFLLVLAKKLGEQFSSAPPSVQITHRYTTEDPAVCDVLNESVLDFVPLVGREVMVRLCARSAP